MSELPEFRDSTRILNWLISFHIFHTCTILVYSIGHTGFLCFILLASNTVIWASLVGAHRSKLEVEDFIFHVVVFSRETFQTLAWKFLLCVLQRVFRVYIFPNFVLVQHIVVQKLVKGSPRQLNTFCLFLLFACNYSNLSEQEAKHTCQSMEQNTNQIYLNSNVMK